MKHKKRRARGKVWNPPQGSSGVVWWAWYGEYLHSPEWAKKRKQRLILDDHRCTLCGHDMGLQVHHLTYDFVGQEELGDLRTLCEPCHKDQHERIAELRKTERKEWQAPKRYRQANARRLKRERMMGPFVQDLKTRRRPSSRPAPQ